MCLNLTYHFTFREETGIDFISVANYTLTFSGFYEREDDLKGLRESWDKLQASGRPINKETVKELAVNHKVLCGKWMFWAQSGGKIDHFWTLVARNIIERGLCASAKVSTSVKENASHVVCIYNSDWTNTEQVLQAEKAIRGIGLRCKLLYKPDVYTHLGIYKKNPWGIRPTIWNSVYDIVKRVSVVENL